MLKTLQQYNMYLNSKLFDDKWLICPNISPQLEVSLIALVFHVL